MGTVIKTLFLLLVIYASFFIVVDMFWSLLSQRPNQEYELIFNYILPWLITFGLMVTGTVEMFKRRHSKKTILSLLLMTGLLEIFTLKWQVDYLIWEIKKGFLNEIIPISTAILIIIAFCIKLLFNLNDIKRAET